MNLSPASISLTIANFQSQTMNGLMNSSNDANSTDIWGMMIPFLASNSTSTDPLSWLAESSSVKGLSPAGRNMALFDPESAYQMMTVINNRDVSYQAQFSELSQMKAYVSTMGDESRSLGSMTLSTSNDSIKSQLQGFVAQYNNWILRFNPDIQQGGLLSDTQAAQVSLHELDQSVENMFYGANDGLHGLKDMGITIDPNTRLASLDTAKLDSVLATNKQGAVNTVQAFSANFTKSASLLNSDNNFIPNQLENLSKAIHYIADNKDALQAEFGTGNPAKPAGQVALALAAYNRTYDI